MKKRTEISIEIEEVIVVSASGKDIQRIPCPICTGEMVTPAEAALTGATVRSLYARVESQAVHFLETADGSLLLCARSLISISKDERGNYEQQ